MDVCAHVCVNELMNLCTIAFLNDARSPVTLLPLVQVAAAAKLVSDINLDAPGDPFSTADIANPHLARYFEVLEVRTQWGSHASLWQFLSCIVWLQLRVT